MAKIFQLIDQTHLGLAAWTAALTRSLSPHRNRINMEMSERGTRESQLEPCKPSIAITVFVSQNE